MRNQLNELSKSKKYLEIFLSLLGTERKTAYAVAVEYGKENQQEEYREKYLPKLYEMGLVNKEEFEDKNKTLWWLNYNKVWDLFFGFFREFLKKELDDKEKEALTKLLVNDDVVKRFKKFQEANLDKEDIYMIFNIIFLFLYTTFIGNNMGMQLKNLIKQSNITSLRSPRQIWGLLDKFAEEKYHISDSKSYREIQKEAYNKVLKNIFIEFEELNNND